MRLSQPRVLLVLAVSVACVVSAGSGSALAAFGSSKSAASNSVTAGYWGCQAGSAVLSTANGSTVQDTYVNQAAAGTNYGRTTPLVVTARNNRNTYMLLQFSPLPAVPASCLFKTATLSVYTTVAKAGLTYNIYNVAAAWVDTSVNWNTTPAVSGAAASVATAAAVGTTSWNVSQLVSAQYGGTPRNGFLVRDSSTVRNTTSYASNESTTVAWRPTLTITWGP